MAITNTCLRLEARYDSNRNSWSSWDVNLGFSKITSHIIAHHYCIATILLAGQSNLPPTYTTPNQPPTITLIDTNEVNKALRGMDLYLPINPFVMFALIHFPILHWKEKQSIYHLRQIIRSRLPFLSVLSKKFKSDNLIHY